MLTFVSTHASREGRDRIGQRKTYKDHVSTHASHEERDAGVLRALVTNMFQLTRPVKDATLYQESTDMITLNAAFARRFAAALV